MKKNRCRERFCGFRRLGGIVAAMLAAGIFPLGARGQATVPGKSPDEAHLLSDAIESVSKRVSPAVVEVLVTGYGTADEDSANPSGPLGRERGLGAGVIVEPDGYIITNYHVVKGTDRVRVVLTPRPSEEPQPLALLQSHGRILPARVVGFSKQIDLAVLKVEATGLPTLPMGLYTQIRKGEIVLAFGSPQGLENSVSFGLVSSVLRQPDPDSPMVYIQTDAAINPGNSGGPLVDLDGNLLGINTFIYTKSGGNEGIGFAIPSGIVRYAYEEIRKNGRVAKRSIGADLQTLTPDLAEGLGLEVSSGVIVSDVPPNGTAERAGLKIEDVIESVNGIPVDNVALFAMSLYMQGPSNSMKLEVWRQGKKLVLDVPVFDATNEPDQLSEFADPSKDLIPRLGILGLTVTERLTPYIGELRIPSGVIVASIVDDRLAVDSGLLQGDVIHSLKGTMITSVDNLRSAFNSLKPGEAATMQVERNGRLTYVTFMME
ncbi:MAG TPA: trypsin-like peptidase domain-containing protein [Verrucomicrobiae bacterium]|nr:trypsin-like peptidase domain-containing protein [Verrucomicrobiae bacterium]